MIQIEGIIFKYFVFAFSIELLLFLISLIFKQKIPNLIKEV